MSQASDQAQPSWGPRELKAEPTRREVASFVQRRTVRSQIGSSPAPAAAAHSRAGPTPARREWITVRSTERTVERPRQMSAGRIEAVVPEQNRTRRMGTSLKTSPVTKSWICLR